MLQPRCSPRSEIMNGNANAAQAPTQRPREIPAPIPILWNELDGLGASLDTRLFRVLDQGSVFNHVNWAG